MRILHSSDWHLGQNFFTKSRKREHQIFINWLLEQIATQHIDALIIAGDLFDNGTPPSYAREMYSQFVVDIHHLNCQLIVLGGNHDSVATLNESKPLLACLNANVIASSSHDLDSQLISLRSTALENQPISALLCAVPFIRPRDLLLSYAGEDGVKKQQALGEAITLHYQQLYQHACEYRQQHQLNVPIIMTGHLTALGVTVTESVRDIYIGNLEAFDAKGFPAADYIALGHIHRPQIVAKQPHIRYSGSPIALSFDEINTQKQLVLIECNQDNVTLIETIAIPSFQTMCVIKGTLLDVEKQLTELLNANSEQNIWLSIEIEEDGYLPDLQTRMQALVEGSHLEILRLRRSRQSPQQSLYQTNKQTLAELSPVDVFEKRLDLEVFTTEEAIERRERLNSYFRQIVAEVEEQQHNNLTNSSHAVAASSASLTVKEISTGEEAV